MADAHAHTRLPAYRLGLLEPADAQDVRDHLRACESCRSLFAGVTEPSEEEERRPGHLPLALITRWDTFQPYLRDDERALLEEHFDDCARCRDSRAFAQSLRALPERRAGSFLGAWPGVAAMAAVLAVAILVVVLRERPAPPVNVPAPSAVLVPVTPAAAVLLRAPTLSLAGVVRGGAPLVVRVPKGANVLPIRVPPLLGVGPEALIDIRVDGPGGIEFGHAELVHRALFGTSQVPSLEARAPEGPLPEGVYHVHVTSNAPVPGGVDYGFDLTSF